MRKKDKILNYSAVIIVVELLFNIARLFQKTVWADECFTIELVKNSVGKIIEGTINDFHPPLYYLICKLFCSILGYHTIVFRIVSLIPVLILAVYGFRWLAGKFNDLTGLIFASLVLMMPTSFYTIEIRMYSWAMLFITLFVFYMVDGVFYRDKKALYISVVWAICGAYSHYFALLVIAIIYFWMIVKTAIQKKEDLKSLILPIVICIAAYLPWIMIVIRQMTGEKAYSMGINSVFYYMKPLAGFICIMFGTLRTISKLTIYEALLTVILCILFFGSSLIYIIKNKKNTDNEVVLFRNILFLLIFTFAFVYLAGCAMDMMSHMFVARYLYPLAGIFYILFSIALGALIKDNAGLIRKICVVAGIVIVLFDFAKTLYDEISSDRKQEVVLDYINDSIGENDMIITDSRLYNWIVFEYYFGDVKYTLSTDQEAINQEAGKYDGTVYYIHNTNDGSVDDPGKDWEYVLTSELGENEMVLYKFVGA